MQLKAALSAAVERLEAAEIGSPRLNAETLLMFVLGVNRAYLYAHPELELSAEEQANYDDVIGQRATGMPSQYITGHQEFWGLDFVVSPAVLIPRPETEHLVETVLEIIREQQEQLAATLSIVDVGTGSGCVALALANELPFAQVYGTDISVEALEIATANAARLQFDNRVKFLQRDVLEGIVAQTYRDPSTWTAVPAQDDKAEFHNLDFVVSNPPYVAFSEADKVQKSVKEFEPQKAVFAGEDGLGVIIRLIAEAQVALKPGGWLAMEIGYSMRDQVLAVLDSVHWQDIRVVPDLQGIPRVIAAQRKHHQ
ncbi:MAG: peptide chain release factor N(5)-glutamine methyltransferase [Candidatus Korobacteraceae bacterium]